MNTGNRVLWTVIGLLLVGLGVVGALVSLDRMPGADRRQSLLWPQLLEQWRRWEGWATAGVIVLGLLAAVLGVLLLRAELRPRGRRHLDDLVSGERARHRPGARPASDEPTGQPPGPAAGVTQVRYRAVAESLERDLRHQQAVHRANVMICGRPDRPEVLLNLTARPGADLAVLRHAVRDALSRFTATTGLTPASVQVNAQVEAGVVSRVS